MFGATKSIQKIQHNLQLKNDPNNFKKGGIAREGPLTLGKGSVVNQSLGIKNSSMFMLFYLDPLQNHAIVM